MEPHFPMYTAGYLHNVVDRSARNVVEEFCQLGLLTCTQSHPLCGLVMTLIVNFKSHDHLQISHLDGCGCIVAGQHYEDANAERSQTCKLYIYILIHKFEALL